MDMRPISGGDVVSGYPPVQTTAALMADTGRRGESVKLFRGHK
jgi:hypothetical protein